MASMTKERERSNLEYMRLWVEHRVCVDPDDNEPTIYDMVYEMAWSHGITLGLTTRESGELSAIIAEEFSKL